MTHRLGTRGSKGSLTIRRGSDWAVQGLQTARMQVRVQESDPATGEFEGWACIYGVKDSYGTTFNQGSFTNGGLEDTAYPLLWMHSAMLPVGTFTATDKDQGLWIAGAYDPTTEGQTAKARALSGSAPELSVGFIWTEDGGEDDPDLITGARLVETSQITLRMAAVPGAGLQSVKSALDLPTSDKGDEARARAAAMLDLRLADAYVLGGN